MQQPASFVEDIQERTYQRTHLSHVFVSLFNKNQLERNVFGSARTLWMKRARGYKCLYFFVCIEIESESYSRGEYSRPSVHLFA